MIEVWLSNRAKADTLAAKAPDMEGAKKALAAMGVQWEGTKKGRTAKAISELEVGLYFSDGKYAGSLYLETVPVPAKTVDGKACQ